MNVMIGQARGREKIRTPKIRQIWVLKGIITPT